MTFIEPQSGWALSLVALGALTYNSLIRWDFSCPSLQRIALRPLEWLAHICSPQSIGLWWPCIRIRAMDSWGSWYKRSQGVLEKRVPATGLPWGICWASPMAWQFKSVARNHSHQTCPTHYSLCTSFHPRCQVQSLEAAGMQGISAPWGTPLPALSAVGKAAYSLGLAAGSNSVVQPWTNLPASVSSSVSGDNNNNTC